MSEKQKILDEHFPLLNAIELAVAINTCKEAGAVNAANALSKHITRLELTITKLQSIHETPHAKSETPG